MPRTGINYMRVDPGFPGHEKAIKAGGEAVWLWLAMKAYAKREGTDGRIPAIKIGRLEGPDPAKQKRLTKRLVDAELLEKRGEDYWLHDYLDWEESADQAEAKRQASRQRKRDWDAKQKAKRDAENGGVSNTSGNGVTNGVTNAVSNTSNPNQPKPTQTNPNKIEEISPRPRPRDPLAYMSGKAPHQRSDVGELFDLFCRTFGFTGRKLDAPNAKLDAETLAEAIDCYGLEDCRLVCVRSRLDRMVTGEADDHGIRHDSIKYIFGNADTFARVLRAARDAGPEVKRGSVRDVIAAAKALGSE